MEKIHPNFDGDDVVIGLQIPAIYVNWKPDQLSNLLQLLLKNTE